MILEHFVTSFLILFLGPVRRAVLESNIDWKKDLEETDNSLNLSSSSSSSRNFRNKISQPLSSFHYLRSSSCANLLLTDFLVDPSNWKKLADPKRKKDPIRTLVEHSNIRRLTNKRKQLLFGIKVVIKRRKTCFIIWQQINVKNIHPELGERR